MSIWSTTGASASFEDEAHPATFHTGHALLTDWRRAESCALQSLTAEVARADADVRDAYTAELRAVIEAATAADEGGLGTTRAEAIAMLALLSGGVSIARAISDPELAREIVYAVHDAASSAYKAR